MLPPSRSEGGTPLFDFSNSRFDPSRISEVCAGPIKVDISSTDADAVVGTLATPQERGSTSTFRETGIEHRQNASLRSIAHMDASGFLRRTIRYGRPGVEPAGSKHLAMASNDTAMSSTRKTRFS